DDLVAWYRNPTGGNSALRIPYKGARFDQSMYPDLVLFHHTDEGIRPSIVDPHGFQFRDAPAKLKGLADYAGQHSEMFNRIDAVVEIDGKLLALDMLSAVVREAVGNLTDDVQGLFETHGGDYS